MSDNATTVHHAMRAVMADLPPIGKDERNAQQGYDFRGIESIMAALHDLLAKHGLHYAPAVTKRISEARATAKGSSMNVVHLHVSYTFFGPAGDSFFCSVWGEGSDSGDKATTKALTMAHKAMLVQVFAIAGASSDPDHDMTPAGARGASPATKAKPARGSEKPVEAGKDELVEQVRAAVLHACGGDVDAAGAWLHVELETTHPDWDGKLTSLPTSALLTLRSRLALAYAPIPMEDPLG